jgi:hypothetical protein
MFSNYNLQIINCLISIYNPSLSTLISNFPTSSVIYHIKSTGLPSKKISTSLQSVKDELELKTPGVYRTPCGCSHVYIGQTGWSINTRLKENYRHIRLEHPNKSDGTEHNIQLHNTNILSTKPRSHHQECSFD